MLAFHILAKSNITIASNADSVEAVQMPPFNRRNKNEYTLSDTLIREHPIEPSQIVLLPKNRSERPCERKRRSFVTLCHCKAVHLMLLNIPR